jgi:putative flippase GtrA
MQIIRYFFVGGVAALIDISIFYVFAQIFQFPWMPVSICSFILATYVNYLLSIKIVFVSDPQKKHKELMGVFLVSGLALIINQLVLYIAIEFLHLPLLNSKVIATGAGFLWNYFGRSIFVFNQHPPSKINHN